MANHDPASNNHKLPATLRMPRPDTPVNPVPTLSSTPDALSLLKAIKRRWFSALMLGIFAAGLAFAGVWMLVPPRYGAFHLIQVSTRVDPILSVRDGQRIELSTVMRTAAARIKSREVAMMALKQDGVRTLPTISKHLDTLSTLTWLEENLKVDYSDGSEILNVSLPGENPSDLVVIVNAIVKSYLQIINGADTKVATDRLEKAKLLHADAKQKLEEKTANKEALLRKQGVEDVYAAFARQQNAHNNLNRTLDQITQLKYELDRKKTQLASLQKQKAEMPARSTEVEITPSKLLEADPLLKRNYEEYLNLQRIVDRMVDSGYRETEFSLRTNRARMNELYATIKTRGDELRSELKAEWAEKVKNTPEGNLAQNIAHLEAEISPLEKHIQALNEKAVTLEKESEMIKRWNAPLTIIESEIQQMERTVAQLHDAVQQSLIAVASEPRIQPIGEAEFQPRDAKKRIMILAGVPMMAFLFAVFGVAYLEFAARRIHDADEVTTSLELPVVGQVPELPDARKRKGVTNPQTEERIRHSLIESIDALRTMLLRNATQENMRVVMVTSAVEGEGKTTLASNLAMSLARAGRKTLLMDCDLRSPAAHQLFEQTLQPGFSEVVLHEVDLPDAVRPTTTDANLYLLPGGQWDREVLQELAKSGTVSIFEKLRDEFDFIIVDSHPVLPATDSLVLGQHVDAVLVSVMKEVSQMHLMHKACQQLATLGIRVFGAVVNGVPVKTYGKTNMGQPVAA